MTAKPLNRLLLAGFPAGVAATLTWHQLTLSLIWGLGLAPFAPFNMAPTEPLGIPAVISLAFWGGIWGMPLALAAAYLPRGHAYWAWIFLLGALGPTLVALLVVVPLKGGSVGAGWRPDVWATALLVNGAWGVGTAVFLTPLNGNWRR